MTTRVISITLESYRNLTKIAGKLQIATGEVTSLSFACGVSILFFEAILDKALKTFTERDIQSLRQALRHKDKLAMLELFKPLLESKEQERAFYNE